jgi:serine/threonine-protein kinase
MSGGATTGAGRSSASSTASAASASSAGLSEALLERAQALLAQHLGPIAKVLVKRAAAQTDRRDVFFTRLSEAVTDPAARDKLMAELARLP